MLIPLDPASWLLLACWASCWWRLRYVPPSEGVSMAADDVVVRTPGESDCCVGAGLERAAAAVVGHVVGQLFGWLGSGWAVVGKWLGSCWAGWAVVGSGWALLREFMRS